MNGYNVTETNNTGWKRLGNFLYMLTINILLINLMFRAVSKLIFLHMHA
jgi:hypothetical protein